jgi:asparagine synthase (glutamine-hydrolysing)
VDRYADHVDHTVLTPCGDDDVLGDLDRFFALMDQPVHGPQLAAHRRIWVAMREAGVRVNLNGAAGDELLAGYGSDYFEPYLRHLFVTGRLGRFAREFFKYSEDEDSLNIHHLRRLYHLLPDSLRPYRNRVLEVPAREDPFRAPSGLVRRKGPAREINRLLLDTMTDWRMNYWCLSGNQNAMGVPLELRSPFLDYRVVESAFTMPLEYLIRDGWLKWIMRIGMEDLLPRSITWRRRKVGFQYPLNQWLPKSRQTLLRWVAASECPFIDQGLLAAGYDDILQRNPNYLWRILSVGLWWRRCVMGQSLDLEGTHARTAGGKPSLAESPLP